MGRRGPKPKPAEVKALIGNPGRRRLALATSTNGSAPVLRRRIAPPEFLNDDERAMFRQVVEALPLDVLRASDRWALGRWCSWLSIFIETKRARSAPNLAPDIEAKLLRRTESAESRLVMLEDRLCLNVASRNSVMARLIAQAPQQTVIAETGEPPEPAAAPARDPDPLGFVARDDTKH